MSDSERLSSVTETPPRKKRKRTSDDVTKGSHLQFTWEQDPYERLHRSMIMKDFSKSREFVLHTNAFSTLHANFNWLGCAFLLTFCEAQKR